MELLIPGLILVGLMVYASTRIKRSAARAFEEETIETSDFILTKPEGMLQILNGDPDLAFEAYSKGFGTVGRREVRLVTAKVLISEQKTEDNVTELSGFNEVIGDHHYRVTESKEIEDGGEFRITRKASDRDGKTIVLEVTALDTVPDQLLRKIDLMIQSFRLTDRSV